MSPTNDSSRPRRRRLDEPVAPAAVASPAERRGETRVPHRAVLIMPFGEGIQARFEQAILIDCSIHGAGFALHRPLRPGVFLFLKLKLTNIALVMYKVRNCRPEDEGYRIGAEYHGVIGNDADRESSAQAVFNALLATPLL